MTVKGLMDELNKHDPTAIVFVYDDENGIYNSVTLLEGVPLKIHHHHSWDECPKGEEPDIIAVNLSTYEKPESSEARGSHAE